MIQLFLLQLLVLGELLEQGLLFVFPHFLLLYFVLQLLLLLLQVVNFELLFLHLFVLGFQQLGQSEVVQPDSLDFSSELQQFYLSLFIVILHPLNFLLHLLNLHLQLFPLIQLLLLFPLQEAQVLLETLELLFQILELNESLVQLLVQFVYFLNRLRFFLFQLDLLFALVVTSLGEFSDGLVHFEEAVVGVLELGFSLHIELVDLLELDEIGLVGDVQILQPFFLGRNLGLDGGQFSQSLLSGQFELPFLGEFLFFEFFHVEFLLLDLVLQLLEVLLISLEIFDLPLEL